MAEDRPGWLLGAGWGFLAGWLEVATKRNSASDWLGGSEVCIAAVCGWLICQSSMGSESPQVWIGWLGLGLAGWLGLTSWLMALNGSSFQPGDGWLGLELVG